MTFLSQYWVLPLKNTNIKHFSKCSRVKGGRRGKRSINNPGKKKTNLWVASMCQAVSVCSLTILLLQLYIHVVSPSTFSEESDKDEVRGPQAHPVSGGSHTWTQSIWVQSCHVQNCTGCGSWQHPQHAACLWGAHDDSCAGRTLGKDLVTATRAQSVLDWKPAFSPHLPLFPGPRCLQGLLVDVS